MTTLISLGNGNLPVGYCPTSWQNLLNEITKAQYAQFNGSVSNSFYNYGDTTPDPDNNAFPWLRITVDPTKNIELNGWYVYSGGFWRRANPIPPGSDVRIIWRGDENSLWLHDGGSGTNPTTNPPDDNTGAMWQIDHDLDGRSPMGVGTIPGMATPKSLGLDEAYGDAEKLFTTNDMPAHHHTVTAETGLDINAAAGGRTLFGTDGITPAEFTGTRNTGDTGGGGSPVNLVHPVLGVYFAKRTARVYYTV